MKQSYKEIGKELVFVCKGLGGVKVCKMGYGCGSFAVCDCDHGGCCGATADEVSFFHLQLQF